MGSLSSARGGRVTTSFLLKKNKIKGPEAPAGRGRGGGVAREGAASQGAARLRGRARVAGVDVARGGHPQEQDAPRAQHHVQHPPELARHHHPHHQARIRRGGHRRRADDDHRRIVRRRGGDQVNGRSTAAVDSRG